VALKVQETDDVIARAPDLKLVGIKTVCDLTSLSRATIYRLVECEKFPKALKLTANRVAWRQQAVLDWLAARE
jgi:prophage regulatory protein